jgi:Protein of unknown function (DUF3467)
MADEKNQLAVDINLDTTPIFYTDSVSINANEDGVVFDFIQRVGNTNRAKVVSRVGMSRVHAKKFAVELGKLLAITEGQVKTDGKN